MKKLFLFILLLNLGIMINPLVTKADKEVEVKNFLRFTLPDIWQVPEEYRQQQNILLSEYGTLEALLDGNAVLRVWLLQDNAATFNMQKCQIRELFYAEFFENLECTSPKSYTEHKHEDYTTSISLSKGTATYKEEQHDVTFVAAFVKIRSTEPLQDMDNSQTKDLLREYSYTSVVFLYFGTPEVIRRYPSADYLTPILDSITLTPFERLHEDTQNQDSNVAPVKREGGFERLWGTGRFVFSPFGEMHLTQSTIERLFDDGDAFVHENDGQEIFNMYCHVVEGSWCYFIEPDKIEHYDGRYDPKIDNDAHQVDRKFSRQVINELGPKFVEHSKNNGVKVRCSRSVRIQRTHGCDVDRGGGWESLPVR